MNESIRVLIVDDSEDDALLLADELRDSGYDLTYLRVDTAEAMRAALREQTWSLIIADYKMPKFSGPDALNVLQESGLDIPFILVSGTAGENIGVEMMHAGAQDFIVKSGLSRLPPAVTRELLDADTRKRRKAAEGAARASAENYRTIFDSAPVVIVAVDRDGMILQTNPAFQKLFGYTRESVVGKTLCDALDQPERAEVAHSLIARVFSGETITNLEWEAKNSDGSTVWLLANVAPVCDPSGAIKMALTMATDITDRKLAEQRQLMMTEHKREFYRRTILAATGGKLVVCEPDEIYEMAEDPIRTWHIAGLQDIETARNEIRASAAREGMEESLLQGFLGCAVEALANVHKHAGGGDVSLHRAGDSLMLVVADSGPGIEALSIPDVALTRGYSTAESLGMGYKVMIEFADRVYLATSPEGTVVGVVIKTSPKLSARQEALEALSGW